MNKIKDKIVEIKEGMDSETVKLVLTTCGIFATAYVLGRADATNAMVRTNTFKATHIDKNGNIIKEVFIEKVSKK